MDKRKVFNPKWRVALLTICLAFLCASWSPSEAQVSSPLFELDRSSFEEKVRKSSQPIVVDVYASWCGPCKKLMPIMESLQHELGDEVTVMKLNIDQEKELSRELEVSLLPTLLFFKDGQVVGSVKGYEDKAFIKEEIQKAFFR